MHLHAHRRAVEVDGLTNWSSNWWTPTSSARCRPGLAGLDSAGRPGLADKSARNLNSEALENPTNHVAALYFERAFAMLAKYRQRR
jgi:hypothetical protein